MKEQILKEFSEWIALQPIKMNISWNKIIAAYIRVSTDRQLELSPLSQLKEIYKYAVNNEMYLDLNNIFIEEDGISAKGSKIQKRTEFNNMIAIAKSKEKTFDTIVVWKFSRFARSQEQSILYKGLLRKECGVDVKSVSEPIIEGPFGELIERIIEWFDEYYLINLSQEVHRGMTENAYNGKWQAPAPFGYRTGSEPGTLIINQEEANIIRLIFNKYLEGMSLINIARYINNLGFRTKRGGKFENRTIVYMLLNPVYIGYSRWTPDGKLEREELFDNTRSIIKKGNWEPIITNEIFQKAREKLQKYRTFRKPRQPEESNPWSWIKGIVRCKKCGHTLIKQKNKIRCNGYNKGTCDVSDELLASEVENLILEQIKIFFDKPFEINVIPKKSTKKINEKDIIVSQLNFLKTKERRIKDSYISGIDSLEEYKENKRMLQIEKQELDNKLSEIKSIPDKKNKIIKEHLKNAYEIISDENIEMLKKYTIAHELINKVEYDNSILTLFFNEIE